MKTTELSREQLIQLKQAMLNTDMDEGVSYDELSRADELVSDDDVHNRFAGIRFSPDDFG
jgi:hypothetical protein